MKGSIISLNFQEMKHESFYDGELLQEDKDDLDASIK